MPLTADVDRSNERGKPDTMNWISAGIASFTTFTAFEDAVLAAGYDEALMRHWPADTVVDTHSHPFDADLLVTRGEMWLTCDGVTRHLRRGDTFHLARGSLHAERYGADGATYWVARRKHASDHV